MRQLLPAVPSELDVDLVAAYAYPERRSERRSERRPEHRADDPPEHRPEHRHWLRANMIGSADGAATVEGRAGGLGNPTDQRVLGLLRALADVVIAGSGTVIAEGYGPARVRPEFQEARAAAGQGPAPLMAVVSNHLRLDFSSRYFIDETRRPIVVTCDAAPKDRLREARKVADVILAGAEVVDPVLMVKALADRGQTRQLCEGGPTLLGAIASAGVLDELCLTISPLLTGGPSRRIVDGPVNEPPLRMRLTQLLIDEADLLYARYEVVK